MRLLLRSALAALALGAPAGAHSAEVGIGSVADVTGAIAEISAAVVEARNFAAQQVNDQGGVLAGDTIRLVLADSACDPKAAVDAANKVVNVEQVPAIVGALCSGATIAMTQSVAIPASVLTLSDVSTSASLTSVADNDLLFRIAPSDLYQGIALAKLVHDSGVKRVAVTYANDDYNSGIRDVFEKEFQRLGGEVAASQIHEPNKPSYRAELATAAKADSEALVIFAYYGSSGISILRDSLENGLFTRFFAADSMLDQAVIDSIGADNLRGKITITVPTTDSDNPSYKVFAEAYRAAGKDPSKSFVANGYDAVFLLSLAIEKAGSADRGKLAAALRDVAGPGGEVIRPGEFAKAKTLIAAGQKVNYEGASGPVDFDAAGDVAGIYGGNTVDASGKWAVEILK